MPLSGNETTLNEIVLLAAGHFIGAHEFSLVVLVQCPTNHLRLEAVVYLDAVYVLKNARKQNTRLPNDSVIVGSRQPHGEQVHDSLLR